MRTVAGRTADFAELAKDCVCFANGPGGVILIGIEDGESAPGGGRQAARGSAVGHGGRNCCDAGTHRRILFRDLMVYKRANEKARFGESEPLMAVEREKWKGVGNAG